MKKNKSVKTCPCGRIITDPKNKTGLCPKCEKAVGRGAAVFGIASLGLWAKNTVLRQSKELVTLSET